MSMLLRKNLLFILFAFVLFFSCRKTEKILTETKSTIETKFFNTHVSSDTYVQKIAAYVSRQNEKYQFLEKLTSRVGFPYWDKSFVFLNTNAATRGSNDSANMIYIPFVRDSQHFVNASLIIKTNASDTSFKFLHDNQYDDYGFDTLKTDLWNARDVFHILANLDRTIFGKRDYKILDSRIFNTDTSYEPIVTFRDGAPITGGKTSLSQPLTACDWIEIGVPCPPNSNRTSVVPCHVSIYECSTYWIEVGGGGGTGGGTGGTGGGTGGTGGGGGWTGDPCPPGEGGLYPRISINEPTEPCGGTGWEPVPIDEYQLTPNDIRAWKEIEEEDAFSDQAPLDCKGTGRLGNTSWNGVLEHMMIQLDYLSTNSFPIPAEREYKIPFSGPSGLFAGYADLANKLTGEIFEIKPESQIIAGAAEVNNYVAKANDYCTGNNGPLTSVWKNGVNYPTKYFPSKDPTKFIKAELSTINPGVIVYTPVDKSTVPQPPPIVVPVSVLDKLKELVRRLKENIPEFETIIAQYMSENPDLVNYIKGAAIGAAVAIIVGTIIEDIATLGGGILDDIPSFFLAYRIVRFAWKL